MAYGSRFDSSVHQEMGSTGDDPFQSKDRKRDPARPQWGPWFSSRDVLIFRGHLGASLWPRS